MQFVSNRAIESANMEMSRSSSKCSVCFLQRSCCICGRLAVLKSTLPKQELKCHVCLFTHYKEYGKASNTGKLLKFAFPGSVTTFILGNAKDDALLVDKITRENTLVLYPGGKSVSLQSVLDRVLQVAGGAARKWHGDGPDPSGMCAEGVSVNLVVIDSTWRQSKAMYRWLSSLCPSSTLSQSLSAPPFCFHVNVDSAVEGGGPSGYLNRRQIFPSKSSTVESAAYALAVLEGPHGLGCGQQDAGAMAAAVLDYCSNALDLSVDGNCTQSGKVRSA